MQVSDARRRSSPRAAGEGLILDLCSGPRPGHRWSTGAAPIAADLAVPDPDCSAPALVEPAPLDPCFRTAAGSPAPRWRRRADPVRRPGRRRTAT